MFQKILQKICIFHFENIFASVGSWCWRDTKKLRIEKDVSHCVRNFLISREDGRCMNIITQNEWTNNWLRVVAWKYYFFKSCFCILIPIRKSHNIFLRRFLQSRIFENTHETCSMKPIVKYRYIMITFCDRFCFSAIKHEYSRLIKNYYCPWIYTKPVKVFYRPEPKALGDKKEKTSTYLWENRHQIRGKVNHVF